MKCELYLKKTLILKVYGEVDTKMCFRTPQKVWGFSRDSKAQARMVKDPGCGNRLDTAGL